MSGKELGQQPAFPRSGFESEGASVCCQGGMALRTHIVIEMAKAFIARPTSAELQKMKSFPLKCAAVSKGACEMADALLEQLAEDQV